MSDALERMVALEARRAGAPGMRGFWFVIPQTFMLVACARSGSEWVWSGGPLRSDMIVLAVVYALVVLAAWLLLCWGEHYMALHSARGESSVGARVGVGAVRLRLSAGKIGWISWSAAVFFLGALDQHAMMISLWSALVCVLVRRLVAAPARLLGQRYADRRELRVMHAALAALLSREDAAPQRAAVTRRFWQEQALALPSTPQLGALTPAVEGSVDALPAQAPPHDATTTYLIGEHHLIVILSLIFPFFIAMSSPGKFLGGVDSVLVSGLIGVLAVVVAVIAAIGAMIEGVTSQRQPRTVRRMEAQQRRLIKQVELAGGLSLAEDAPDEALRGALSGDVAQPGALSEVEP